MKQLLSNLNKTSTTSIIAILIMMGFIILSTAALFHKPADKDLALLVIGNIYGLSCFVAGYYFNKKTEEAPLNNNRVTTRTQETKTFTSTPTEEE